MHVITRVLYKVSVIQGSPRQFSNVRLRQGVCYTEMHIVLQIYRLVLIRIYTNLILKLFAEAQRGLFLFFFNLFIICMHALTVAKVTVWLGQKYF